MTLDYLHRGRVVRKEAPEDVHEEPEEKKPRRSRARTRAMKK
jgi:hypothetical protein